MRNIPTIFPIYGETIDPICPAVVPPPCKKLLTVVGYISPSKMNIRAIAHDTASFPTMTRPVFTHDGTKQWKETFDFCSNSHN